MELITLILVVPVLIATGIYMVYTSIVTVGDDEVGLVSRKQHYDYFVVRPLDIV